MAPKADIKALQRSVQALSHHLASLQKAGDKGKGSGWNCGACAEGAYNFHHRTVCFKCGAPRGKAPRPGGSPAPGGGQVRARSRQAPVQKVARAPAEAERKGAGQSALGDAPGSTLKGTPPPGADGQDAVAIELAIARSHQQWAARLKEPARGVELPKAEKRLAEAQAACQERRPPPERLQAALSRVEAKQRRLDEAR